MLLQVVFPRFFSETLSYVPATRVFGCERDRLTLQICDGDQFLSAFCIILLNVNSRFLFHLYIDETEAFSFNAFQFTSYFLSASRKRGAY